MARSFSRIQFHTQYKLRWTNIVTNILSCQGAIVEAIALSTSIGDLSDEIQVAHNTDPTIKQLIQQIESGILYIEGRWPFVPQGGQLRHRLFQETHDVPFAGHPR
ncbi:unnamed protein product [Spirodela intermedia]|uniref:Uncharacterized protein n=1 Tax=Spirodela intermedia TaxID=51605 RepID=A0A7I8JI74_SPIIN|nr:unnamed protein product [Spirodela intermedia]CAA6669846.1 unnamed protein product [Spirodela intermedia]